jgi:hypothetical protein
MRSAPDVRVTEVCAISVIVTVVSLYYQRERRIKPQLNFGADIAHLQFVWFSISGRLVALSRDYRWRINAVGLQPIEQRGTDVIGSRGEPPVGRAIQWLRQKLWRSDLNQSVAMHRRFHVLRMWKTLRALYRFLYVGISAFA